MEAKKYNQLRLHGSKRMFFVPKSSKRHYNKVLTMKTATNKAKPKNSREKCKNKMSKPFEKKTYSQNFIYDSLNVFSKPMGTIKTRII